MAKRAMEHMNKMPRDEAIKAFYACCGCKKFSESLADARPFTSTDDLFAKSDSVWATCGRDEILEAFLAHPKIGDSKAAAAHGGRWASNEQKGMSAATESTADGMKKGNAEYEAKMGFRYIVCATGKTAEEMLGILEARITNDPMTELKNGADEQNKITHLRLNKLIAELSGPSM